jgi:nucleoside-diphosphate-sugar epimerase
MRILITGGAGYIGSVLTAALLEDGHDVTVLDNFMYRQTSLNMLCAYHDFDVIRGDARDAVALLPLIRKADVVIPLAGLVGASLCASDMAGAETTNLGAVVTAISLMSREQLMLIPITNSGYGVGEPGIECTEETPMRPISLYGRTKVEAEKIALDHGNAISFRLATVFGMSARMRIDLLVNDFVYRAVTDRAVVLFESHFKRNYIHVRDVARAFCHGIDNFDAMKGRPYNVGLSDANLSKLELCERIKARIPAFVFLEAPIGEDQDKRDYIVSNARIEATGWRPTWTLDAGIDELVKGYRMIRNTIHGNA